MTAPENANSPESAKFGTDSLSAAAVAGGVGAGVGTGTALVPLAGSMLGGIAAAAIVGGAVSAGTYYGLQCLR